MATDQIAAVIAELEEASPLLIHVGSPSAYEAFSSGKLLFDLGTDAALLEFKSKNYSEWGDKIQIKAGGIGVKGHRVYTLCNEDLVYKYQTQPDLIALEKECPGLF